MSYQICLIYTPKYDIRFFGLELLHPFDSRKYSRAWKYLRSRFGPSLDLHLAAPAAPISNEDLALVHTDVYLNLLDDSRVVAQALEVPILGYLPRSLLDRAVVKPMRWATAGTVDAAEWALDKGCAVNFAGGYHHANSQRGEGFCLFSDVGIAVRKLRKDGKLNGSDRIGIIDLDAHQGNGFERVFMDDANTSIFDIYNSRVYPQDAVAKEGIDVDIPLPPGVSGDDYLDALRAALPAFLDTENAFRLVFYNAGTDTLLGDPLGGMGLSAEQILMRDQMVFDALLERQIPFVMLPSGGYTKQSYALLAESVAWLLQRLGVQPTSTLQPTTNR